MKALVKIDYLTKEEYLSLNEMLTSNNEALFIHENSVAIEIGDAPKESFVGRVAYPNCFAYKYDDGTTIYRLYTNKNHYMLTEQYYKALSKYPHCFGTGKASDVIEALFNTSQARSWNWNIDRYVKYLTDDGACYFFYKDNNEKISPEMLRVDLLRLIKDDEFVSGIFHVFKHFSIHGQNLSTNASEKRDIGAIPCLLSLISEAIYFYPDRQVVMKGENKDKPYLVVDNIAIDDNHVGKLSFFQEPTSGVFFVNSCVVKKRKKGNDHDAD